MNQQREQAQPEFSKPLAARPSGIPGVVLLDLSVHGDNRGWFKENWQREKMLGIGLPDFQPVQNNVSFNAQRGTTRGLHAEPWDKLVSVAVGKVFGAWVDLRHGPTFGAVFTAVIDPATAVYVPAGVANGFQTLVDGTAYSYLVNEHWSAAAQANYTFVNLADPQLAIDWPIELAHAELSEADKNHPALSAVTPIKAKKTLVIGAGGQLGKAFAALCAEDPDFQFMTREQLNLGDPEALNSVPWAEFKTVINAAAYTKVDAAEEATEKAKLWASNATGVAELAKICSRHRLTLVHFSSDYVFDGSLTEHPEEEPFSPLGAYGQAKAAGDLAAASTPRHYILRTSWVVGDSHNFVTTMAQLAAKNISPQVVADQRGRLTFAPDLAAAVVHLLKTQAPFGVYNMTNSGPTQSWADIATRIFQLCSQHSGTTAKVLAVSTEDYFADKPHAPRPLESTLSLKKLEATGFSPPAMQTRLEEYVSQLLPES